MENIESEKEVSYEKKGWARYLAVRILSRFERSDSYIDKLLAHELSHNDLSVQDKALLNELVNGVIRWKGKLDWCLTGFYNGDYQKCLNIVKNAMRVGLYQIMYLEKIPYYAAIDESVEIVKQIQGERTAGIVNAVLRNLHRNMDKIRYPDQENDPIYYLSVFYSHPKWMVKRWVERFGYEETEQLLIANNTRPPITVRVNTRKSSVERISSLFEKHEVPFHISPYLSESIVVDHPRFDMSQTEIFRVGEITIQDTSASLAVRLANPQKGMTVLDVAAAPGGKSFYLAQLMDDQGKVISVEKYSSKMRFIEEGKNRLGLTSIETMAEDARLLRLKDKVDLIFADVPCSGLGTLRKKSDIKWKRELDDLKQITDLQKEILSNAYRLLKPGGAFVYSTCTIEPEENTEIVEWFLKEFPDMKLDPAENYLPAEVCKDGFLQTFTHIHHCDGAFAARLIKSE